MVTDGPHWLGRVWLDEVGRRPRMQWRYPIYFAWPVHAMHAPVWCEMPMMPLGCSEATRASQVWMALPLLTQADDCCFPLRLSLSASVLHISVRTLPESFCTRNLSDPCTVLREPEAPANSPVILYRVRARSGPMPNPLTQKWKVHELICHE
jgi:hypothetical protein